MNLQGSHVATTSGQATRGTVVGCLEEVSRIKPRMEFLKGLCSSSPVLADNKQEFELWWLWLVKLPFTTGGTCNEVNCCGAVRIAQGLFSRVLREGASFNSPAWCLLTD